ncbi:MAG: hypothetical protein J7L82_02135, partial [Staphylothermus sp.]|nr:hypothetical protein [Staphylothermus sp.]
EIIEFNECHDSSGNVITLPIVLTKLKDFYTLSINAKLSLSSNIISFLHIAGDLDALIKINGKPFYGVDQWTKSIPLLINEPEPLIEFVIYPETIVGEKYKPIKIDAIILIEYDKEILEYTKLGKNVIDLIKNINDEDLRKELLMILYEAMNEIHIQTPSLKQLQGLNIVEKHALTMIPFLTDELLRIIKNEPHRLLEKGYGSVNWEALKRETRRAKKKLVDSLKDLAKKVSKERNSPCCRAYRCCMVLDTRND